MRQGAGSHIPRINPRHKLFGHVFSGRYRAQLVEGSGNGYLRTACDYVHLNPVRARMLKAGERLLAYPWSSFGAYFKEKNGKTALLDYVCIQEAVASPPYGRPRRHI